MPAYGVVERSSWDFPPSVSQTLVTTGGRRRGRCRARRSRAFGRELLRASEIERGQPMEHLARPSRRWTGPRVFRRALGRRKVRRADLSRARDDSDGVPSRRGEIVRHSAAPSFAHRVHGMPCRAAATAVPPHPVQGRWAYEATKDMRSSKITGEIAGLGRFSRAPAAGRRCAVRPARRPHDLGRAETGRVEP